MAKAQTGTRSRRSATAGPSRRRTGGAPRVTRKPSVIRRVARVIWVSPRHAALALATGLVCGGLASRIGGMISPPYAAILGTLRGVIVIALAVLAAGTTAIFAFPRFWPVLAANTVLAIVGDVFGPAVAALTLGLFAKRQLASRMGRDAAFDRAGNVFIAAVAGFVGWLFGQRAVFLLGPIFAAFAIAAVLSIPAKAIDHNRARGADSDEGSAPKSGWQTITGCRPLIVFCVCAMLFPFANAPLLPLVGQKLAAANKELATAVMSSCIVAAQLVMLPVALVAGRHADHWGRKPFLLAGFAILPVRAVLYTLSDNSAWLIGVQLLDGIGAGIFGALTPLVAADLMRDTALRPDGLNYLTESEH
jgi:MFS family permease